MREAPLDANARCMESEEDDDSAKTRVDDVSGETMKNEGRDAAQPTRLIITNFNQCCSNISLYFTEWNGERRLPALVCVHWGEHQVAQTKAEGTLCKCRGYQFGLFFVDGKKRGDVVVHQHGPPTRVLHRVGSFPKGTTSIGMCVDWAVVPHT